MEAVGNVLRSLDALASEAAAFVHRLSPKEGGATLITLSGELGAGKTTFVQSAARALGVTDHVTSPTFVLAKMYTLPAGSFERLVHIDAYRLRGGGELHGIRFDELMRDSSNLILLEWPEMVRDGLPDADISITLTALPDESRAITYA